MLLLLWQPLRGHAWICERQSSFQRFNIYIHSQLNKRAGGEIAERTWINLHTAMVCHFNFRNDTSRTKTVTKCVSIQESCTLCQHEVDSSVSWQPQIQGNNQFTQIYEEAWIGWDADEDQLIINKKNMPWWQRFNDGFVVLKQEYNFVIQIALYPNTRLSFKHTLSYFKEC